MSRTDPQFNLRIPAELRDKISRAAERNKRSATAEIISRLEQSFERDIARFIHTGVSPNTTLDEIEEVKLGLSIAMEQLAQIQRAQANQKHNGDD
ncbi:hypothetical protein CXF92_18540 [Pseudomonas sp. Choline-3u-10]|uniref:Putative Arc repressor family protein n=1 Tax=viral metagenome TaxID=1070528 RepID=A0A6H1ZJV4_9ZZZZ|nr:MULTISPECIES: Arc family DNA-binding protein [Pseudomonadaceae]MBK3797538.1 Arc family DNA-binding protein [Stutzerimonas stutzeri]MBK3876377.1 Arc family DNA-binding protein [Stutzerimonas stutzeri]PKG90916.1 hypothetical protein CXF92_18540 [Pseudomonas sp. Choline-3u-10]